MEIVMLGTGTSHGVPTIDCMLNDYRTCQSGVCQRALTDPRYRRTRSSILVRACGKHILVDTSQDFREQMLANRVTRLDAVLFSHGHADHVYGLADIRSYSHHQNHAIDIYGSPETLQTIRGCFDYVFRQPHVAGSGIPNVQAHELVSPRLVAGVEVIPIPVEHGPMCGCQGYRIGDTAYIPDVKAIPESSLELLRGLDLLILNCLRLRPHGSHLSLQESLDYARAIGPRRCLFTHMTHDIDYQIEEPKLPEWIRFAYDGQIVTSE